MVEQTAGLTDPRPQVIPARSALQAGRAIFVDGPRELLQAPGAQLDPDHAQTQGGRSWGSWALLGALYYPLSASRCPACRVVGRLEDPGTRHRPGALILSPGDPQVGSDHLGGAQEQVQLATNQDLDAARQAGQSRRAHQSPSSARLHSLGDYETGASDTACARNEPGIKRMHPTVCARFSRGGSTAVARMRSLTQRPRTSGPRPFLTPPVAHSVAQEAPDPPRGGAPVEMTYSRGLAFTPQIIWD